MTSAGAVPGRSESTFRGAERAIAGDRDPADVGQRGGEVDAGVGEHGAGRRVRDDVRQLARDRCAG